MPRKGVCASTNDEADECDDIGSDDATYRGDAYATYGWGCTVAAVERDPCTYEVRPTRVTAVVEIGRAGGGVPLGQ